MSIPELQDLKAAVENARRWRQAQIGAKVMAGKRGESIIAGVVGICLFMHAVCGKIVCGCLGIKPIKWGHREEGCYLDRGLDAGSMRMNAPVVLIVAVISS